MHRRLAEIRLEAGKFAEEWKDARYERGETQSFYNEFFEIFGVRRRRVASFEEPVRKLGDKRGFIDLFWKGVLLVEHKSAHGDLKKAKEQALDYFPGLDEDELPRYILVCDFQQFELYDLDERKEWRFPLSDLPQKVELFNFIRGAQPREFRDQDPVNIKASRILAELHDELEKLGYSGHALESFMVRLLFCLFADDTGIFEPRGIFEDLISKRTNVDGSDVGPWLAHLFQVLDQQPSGRPKGLDEDLAQFEYINGALFSETLRIPSFDSRTRKKLLEACDFDWSRISPAIFGSIFQEVLKENRRSQGAHYTTEKNIKKVIEPLFLDEFRKEFDRLKARRDTGRRQALTQFHQKLASLKFLDPACGCGNFLIIAYRELRLLEIELLMELYPDKQLNLDPSQLSLLNVDQFFGIEIQEAAVRIAEVALWMMDHIMNTRLSAAFGLPYKRIPLRTTPHIHHADALELDWEQVLAARECSYILGNPPFIGSKMQSDMQRAQVKRIAQSKRAGGLDYVTAWFLKAAQYAEERPVPIAFVATNSISQGEQVAQLWPQLFDRYGLEIAFAHRTFAWGSDARGMAHVHVIILGLTTRDSTPLKRRLYTYEDIQGEPTETEHASITAYLFDGSASRDPHLVVDSASRSLTGMPSMGIGSKPIDDGEYIFTAEERKKFLHAEPRAKPFLRPFVGSEELINGGDRWILCLQEVQPERLRSMPEVMKRMNAVQKFRAKSKSAPTRAIAKHPTQFHVNVLPNKPFLVVPETSSERRQYAPLGYMRPPVVPSSLVRIIENGPQWLFALLSSHMHMAWLRHIGGRLESRYRYSIGIVYNPFPFPKLTEAHNIQLTKLAQEILKAREEHGESTLADLYDPLVMPIKLRRAHERNDAFVDSLYRRTSFASEMERVEHLFGLYSTLRAPVLPLPGKAKRRTR